MRNSGTARPGSPASAALCGETVAEWAGFPRICGLVRKDARQSHNFAQESPGLVLHGSVKGVPARGE